MPEKLSNSDAQAAMTLADKGIDLSMIASKFPQRDYHRYNQDSNNAYALLSFVVLSLSLSLSLYLSISIQVMLKVKEESVDLAVHPEKYTSTPSSDVPSGGGGGGGEQQRDAAVGKLIGDEMQLKLDALEEEDPDLCCPVMLGLFVDPVTLPDGFSYERETVRSLIRDGDLASGMILSPMTRQLMPAALVDAPKKKKAAREFREVRARELTTFASEAFEKNPSKPHLACQALERVSEYVAALQQQQQQQQPFGSHGGGAGDGGGGGASLELCEYVQKVCTALITAARTADNPEGVWLQPKPAALRSLAALKLQAVGAGDDSRRKVTCIVVSTVTSDLTKVITIGGTARS